MKKEDRSADIGALLEEATGLLLERTIRLIREMDGFGGTSVKWTVADENGDKRTVERSVTDMAALIEKLSKTVAPDRAADDPLLAFIRRLDDEADSQ